MSKDNTRIYIETYVGIGNNEQSLNENNTMLIVRTLTFLFFIYFLTLGCR